MIENKSFKFRFKILNRRKIIPEKRGAIEEGAAASCNFLFLPFSAV